MALFAVRSVPYGWLVEWPGPRHTEDAVVIAESTERTYYCCRCGKGACPHARAVLHHVMDREAE